MSASSSSSWREQLNMPGRRHALSAVLMGLILVGLLLAIYRDILFRLGQQWYLDPDYSHGFLVPVLSLYFIWERRRQLQSLQRSPSVVGIGLLAFGLLMLFMGSVGAELYLQRTSLIVVIAGLVLLLLGGQFLRLLAFPIAFLFFMVPLPAIVMNAIAFPLQLFAAQTASFCLFKLGIPVLREGNIIMLASTTLEVAEACSGIRSLQALLALGTVYAYFTQPVMWKRWVLVLLSVPIAIVANAFRVSGTGVLAHYWGAQAAEGFYHTFSGWLIFVVAFALLLGSGAVLSRIGRSPAHSRSTEPGTERSVPYPLQGPPALDGSSSGNGHSEQAPAQPQVNSSAAAPHKARSNPLP
jgi:exosortase